MSAELIAAAKELVADARERRRLRHGSDPLIDELEAILSTESGAGRADGLSSIEGRVHDALVEAVRAFRRVPRMTSSQVTEFCEAIHRAQDLLAGMAMSRLYPDGWAAPELIADGVAREKGET